MNLESAPVWPETVPNDSLRRSYREAEPGPWWLSGDRPEPHPPLPGPTEADLVVIGGGLTGLWAAIIAKQRDPGRDVVLIERETLAIGASGRNGGFMSSSLVHGIGNGLARFPDEVQELERLGIENLDAIRSTITGHGIECDLIPSGVVEVAYNAEQMADLGGMTEELAAYGHEAVVLDQDQIRGELDSPLFVGGAWQKSGEVLIDPVKLCDGLTGLAESLGVRIHERTEMTGLEQAGAGIEVKTGQGKIRAGGALLATSAFRSPVAAIRHRVIPVYDYVLVTEPLSAEQEQAIGWKNRQGFSDNANQFHYFRPINTPEGLRILWGGYDAVYNFGGKVEDSAYQREHSFAGLAQRFFTAFPQLEGLRFSHRWGGAIDTCSRFFAFYGTSLQGRVSWAVGHTGLGVGASRFSAGVALDFLDRIDSPVTRMKYATSKPIPFPPEPIRYGVVQYTRDRLAAADRNGGRRGLWLRTLDKFGLGFDS